MGWFEIRDCSGIRATVDLTNTICVAVFPEEEKNIRITLANGADILLSYGKEDAYRMYKEINEAVDRAHQQSVQPYDDMIKRLKGELGEDYDK